MKIDVLLFATLKDRAGTPRLRMDIPDGADIGQLKALLSQMQPALAPALGTTIAAVNHEFAFPETPLHEGDEVALFPPVSGGNVSDRRRIANDEPSAGLQPGSSSASHPPSLPELFLITENEPNLNELVAFVTRPTTGAVCLFTGTVRGQTEDRQTVRLEYEAYTPMAEGKMRQVAAEMRARWPTIEGIAIVQRIGRLDVGDLTVLIAVSASHRDAGVFEAARYGIDRLKEIVPIWKKEIGPQGETWVEGHYHPTSADVPPGAGNAREPVINDARGPGHGSGEDAGR